MLHLLLLLSSVWASEFSDVVRESHSYYEMHLYRRNAMHKFDEMYVDMRESAVHTFLSSHSQAAEAVAFSFPFYGHTVHKLYITTHGFLSLAPRLHNLMYKTQYIAPLRVKLDPSRSEKSTINYKQSSQDSLTIQWTNVSVAEPLAHPSSEGLFTFQTTIFTNGTIVFAYKKVPDLLAADALYDHEPVAGLSDAFLVGDRELHVYHTLNVANPDIMSGTVVVFEPKPTCIAQDNCHSCNRLRDVSDFRCVWCPSLRQCSDGADRLREKWDDNGCSNHNTSSVDQCHLRNPLHAIFNNEHNNDVDVEDDDMVDVVMDDKESKALPRQLDSLSLSGTATLVSACISALLLLVLLVLLAALLLLYGKRHPGSFAEQLATRLSPNYARFRDDHLEMSSEDKHINNNNVGNNTVLSF